MKRNPFRGLVLYFDSPEAFQAHQKKLRLRELDEEELAFLGSAGWLG